MLTDQAFVTSRKTVSVPYSRPAWEANHIENGTLVGKLVTIHYHLDNGKVDYKH